MLSLADQEINWGQGHAGLPMYETVSKRTLISNCSAQPSLH